MSIRQLDDGSVVYFDSRGIIQSYELGPGVLLHISRGIMSGALAEYVTREGERQLRKAGRCTFMVDGRESKLMTTEFREAMTEWFRANESVAAHMLIGSHLLEMAIRVASLTIRMSRVVPYSQVDEWEAVGRRETPSFLRRPFSIPVDLQSSSQERFSSGDGNV